MVRGEGYPSRLPVTAAADRIRYILARLDAAVAPDAMDLPGFHFHGLHGKPKRFSVRVTGNYRITFGWDGEDAVNVDIEDYP